MEEMDIRLIVPSEAFLEEYYQLCRESYSDLRYAYIMHNPDEYDTWRDTIFETYRKNEEGIDLPEGFIPSKTYWIISGPRVVGIVNIRLGLTESLRHFGGHLGIFVRKSERRKGIAKRAFALMLEESRRLKLTPVLVTVEADNLPSCKMVESFPYKSKEIEDIVFEGRDTRACRYWFE